MNQSTIPVDLRERIIEAATDLYAQAGREKFPTVDAVRRLSRADMNAVSLVMKEWRQAQTTQAAPVAVAVPEAVQQAGNAVLIVIWQQATELANQSLRAAQAGWESERQELDDMRSELANGYEAQAAELESIRKQLTDSEIKAADQAKELVAVSLREVEAINRAERAEVRIAEIEHRATDLRENLDRAHAEAERQRVELAEVRTKASAEIDAAHAEVIRHKQEAANERDLVLANLATVKAKAEVAEQRSAERIIKAESDLTAAQTAAAEARERAAGLAGQIEAMQNQATELMRALATLHHPQEEVSQKPAA